MQPLPSQQQYQLLLQYQLRYARQAVISADLLKQQQQVHTEQDESAKTAQQHWTFLQVTSQIIGVIDWPSISKRKTHKSSETKWERT